LCFQCFSYVKYNQLRNNVNDDGVYVQELQRSGPDSVHLEDYKECPMPKKECLYTNTVWACEIIHTGMMVDTRSAGKKDSCEK